MLSNIKLDRVFLNILLFIFYVLLVTIAFSFLFPILLISIGQEVLNPNDPIFDNIQIGIFVVTFIFTISFRKYCYFPIIKINNVSKIKAEVTKKGEKDSIFLQKDEINNIEEIPSSQPELDIKIGKEIK